MQIHDLALLGLAAGERVHSPSTCRTRPSSAIQERDVLVEPLAAGRGGSRFRRGERHRRAAAHGVRLRRRLLLLQRHGTGLALRLSLALHLWLAGRRLRHPALLRATVYVK